MARLPVGPAHVSALSWGLPRWDSTAVMSSGIFGEVDAGARPSTRSPGSESSFPIARTRAASITVSVSVLQKRFNTRGCLRCLHIVPKVSRYQDTKVPR